MEFLTGRLSALPLVAPPSGTLDAALDWFSGVSSGRAQFAVRWLTPPPLTPADQLLLGGAPEPAREVLPRLAPADGGPLFIFGPQSAQPHCWHMADGRRYALVPAGAPLAVIAHELGHLLFGWPDLRLPRGSAARCLMAPLSPGPPDPPSAAMRVAAGWETPQALSAGMPANALPERRCYAWADMLIERQRETLVGFRSAGRAVSLAFAVPATGGCALALASRASA
jgi:hypothetical protein